MGHEDDETDEASERWKKEKAEEGPSKSRRTAVGRVGVVEG